MKYLTAFHHNNRQRRGFSLAETLIVVGILVILMALLVPNIIRAQRELRQKELDAKAEIIYVAAQNELSKLRSGGNGKAYGANLAAVVDNPYEYELDGTTVYRLADDPGITSEDKNWIAGNADPTLLGNHWVILYDLASASVIEVYYCEEKATEDTKDFYESFYDINTDYRTRSKRMPDKVGYYGANEALQTGKIIKKLSLGLEVIDSGEKLIIQMSAPAGESFSNLVFTLKIADVDGGANGTKTITFPSYDSNSIAITLDAVDAPFWESEYAQLSGGLKDHLIPGKLTLTLSATADNTKFNNKTLEVNSLFDQSNLETDWNTKAVISCGRHLQNLDKKQSRVPDSVTKAEQISVIDFVSEKETDSEEDKTWQDYYSDRAFVPILNYNLVEYDGKNQSILGLTVEEAVDGKAGLFAETSNNTSLHDIRLVDSKVSADSGDSAVGTLVGTVSGSCTIENCEVLLDEFATGTVRAEKIKTDTYLIKGKTVGGLVGMNNGTLSIENSFAATTVGGLDAETVGGLVGTNDSDLEIDCSYADCYFGANLTSGKVGGLVGSSAATTCSVTDCYAAGYLNTPVQSAHGLVYTGSTENTGNIKSSYSILDLSAFSEIPDIYYNTEGEQKTITAGLSSIELKTALGEGVWEKSASANPYNLDSLARDPIYTNPALRDMKHYGDWKVSFQPGSMVYYEVYADGTCGFSGAGVATTLKNIDIVGDGYGIVFRKDTVTELEVKVYNGSTDVSKPDATQKHLTVTPTNLISSTYSVNYGNADKEPISGSGLLTLSIGEGIYNIYPLDKTIVNDAPNGFWQKAKISFKLKNGEPKVLYYAFNPLLGDVKQQVDGDSMEGENPTLPKDPALPSSWVQMRSPRQLNALSDYYSSKWSNLSCKFTQTRTLNYQTYSWSVYSLKTWNDGLKQPPIGTELAPFECAYDGNYLPITGFNIDGGAGFYSVGLFGTTKGWMQNIVFAANVDPKTGSAYYSVKRNNIPEGVTVYMGTLVGHNEGTLHNCAVAGYQLRSTNGTEIYTFNNSTLYIGGLVGRNDGTISNCSAVFPEINVNALYSNIAMGGLIGRNSRTVQNCYAIGRVSADVKESAANAAGFAGANLGAISNSYCAVSTNTSGSAKSYAFAPTSGPRVVNCYFLHNGTYNYLEKLHAFSVLSTENGAEGKDYNELMDMRGTAWVGSANTGYDAWAKNASYDMDDGAAYYPFRGVVVNGYGYAHYGDWPVSPMMGDYGVFYWEHETEGTNDGYHFSFLGVKENEGADPTVTRGSTLCISHDDGGVIKEYGYGYYHVKTMDVAAAWQQEGTANVAFWGRDEAAGSTSRTAEAELERQIADYEFVTYRTAYSKDKTGDYLFLEGDYTSAKLELTQGENKRTYCISPFFADAMSRCGLDNLKDEKHAYEWQTPGAESNPYRVRSIEQLQYINWNKKTHDCESLIKDVDTAKEFPYLMYTNGEARQGFGNNQTIPNHSDRKDLHWKQSHDLNGKDLSADAYTPIAGNNKGTNQDTAQTCIYGWFGGHYDGRSYKIQNLSIESSCYSVGLFGVTVGANIKNIILYGDGNTHVMRTTPGAGIGNPLTGAYQLGGLIGLAYDYDKNSTNVIENCAIADYQIIDESTNGHGRGHASIGGLIGMASVSLKGCSAVTDIHINCMHQFGRQKYGTYIHVGGLAGSAKYNVINCYTGGSITVADKTLNEFYLDDVRKVKKQEDLNAIYCDLTDRESADYQKMLTALNTQGNKFMRQYNVMIDVAGLSGGVYSAIFTNFDGSEIGNPEYKNCYTYMSLPTLEGTIKTVARIATIGNAYDKTPQLKLTNCYYLDEAFAHLTWDSIKQPEYYFLNGPDNAPPNQDPEGNQPHRITEQEWSEMLYGKTDCNKYIISGSTRNETEEARHVTGMADQQHPILYDVLSSESGITSLGRQNGWNEVTKQAEDGSPIHGKYSFSSRPEQEGMDYPFPTVLRQVDDDDDPSNDPWVHYGRWSNSGAYWEVGRVTMDIFEELAKAENPKDAWAEIDLTLHLAGTYSIPEGGTVEEDGTCGDLKFTVRSSELTGLEDTEKIAKVVKVEPYGSSLKVTLRALRDGAVTLMAEATDRALDKVVESASCSVKITALLNVTPSPTSVVLLRDRSEPIVCEATAEKGKKIVDSEGTETVFGNYTTDGLWSVMPETDKDYKALISVYQKATDENAEDPWPLAVFAYNGTETKAVSEGMKMLKKNNQPVMSVPINGNSFKVDRSHPGNCYVTVTYSYDYHSDEDGSMLSAAAVVQVRKMGFVGLMNALKRVQDPGQNWYQVWTRRLSGDESIAYRIPDADMKKLSAPQGADIFLFGAAAEDDLEELEKPDPMTILVYENGEVSQNYTVDFFTVKDEGGRDQKEITTSGDYTLHGATVRIKNPTSPETKTVSVSVELQEPLSETPENPVRYTLRVDNVKAYPYTLHFDIGTDDVNATGVMRPVGVGYDSVLPDGKLCFKRTGYKFSGWKLGTKNADGSVTVGEKLYDNYQLPLLADPENGEKEEGAYYFSDLVTEGKYEILLVAQWEPVRYKVYFYPGYGNGNPVEMDFDYDGVKPLPNPKDSNMFSNIPKNYKFLHWNTRKNGMGEQYDAGETTNLTDQNGATILLFAQWQEMKKLTLLDDASQELGSFVEPEGYRLPEDEYTELLNQLPQKPDGWKFIGWFYIINPTTSIQVLDEQGQIVDDNAGNEALSAFISDGEFQLTENLTLQARWKKLKTLTLLDDESNTLGSFLEPEGSALPTAEYSQLNLPTKPAEWKFIGWFYHDSATNQDIQVLDKDGKIVNELNGFISGGEFHLTADLTLQAQWKEQTSKTLTLVNGNNPMEPFTIEAGQSIANLSDLTSYNPPQFTGWTLDGWYTAQDTNGVKVFKDDGSVDPDASGEGFTVETVDGTARLSLTEDVTLYSRWRRTIYVQVDASGPEDNARYLIAGGRTTNNGLTTVALINSNVPDSGYKSGNNQRYESIGTTTGITVHTGVPWLENAGDTKWIDHSDIAAVNALIDQERANRGDTVDGEYLLWTTEASEMTTSAVKYSYFTIKKDRITYYLTTNSYDDVFHMRRLESRASNKCSMCYEVNTADNQYVFQSYWLKIDAREKNHCVYYSGKWKTDSVWSTATHNTYLFKEQYVYTFNPS